MSEPIAQVAADAAMNLRWVYIGAVLLLLHGKKEPPGIDAVLPDGLD
jgi:hypothetical protein